MLVCHPGGPGFSGWYFEDLAGMAAERTLVLVNPAGTEGSDPWPEEHYSLERRADDVDDLCVALGAEPIDFLGHSAGGFVGMRYAALHPERLERLVLLGTFPRFTDDLRAALVQQRLLHEREPWFDDALEAAMKRAARDYVSDDEFHDLYSRQFRFNFAHYGDAERAFMERLRAVGAKCDRRTLESFNDQVSTFDLHPDLPNIAAPTLIVNGELEASRAGERELLDGIRNSALAIVEGAGHFPFVEQPERFRAAVLPFLSE